MGKVRLAEWAGEEDAERTEQSLAGTQWASVPSWCPVPPVAPVDRGRGDGSPPLGALAQQSLVGEGTPNSLGPSYGVGGRPVSLYLSGGRGPGIHRLLWLCRWWP